MSATISCQAEEAAHSPRQSRLGPIVDGLDLSGVHSDAGRRDDVTKVGNGGDTE